MALVLANRVQETGTAVTTVSFTLTGAVAGFQTFAAIGNTNTTYYAATDASGNWEVGLGTYLTVGPSLTRTTVYASSNSGSAVTFSGTCNIFVTYPSGRSVNLDASGNVSALGTIASGTWNGSTIPVAYGGTGVTVSSGASSVMLRDANQNVSINRLNQSNTNTAAAGATTALTAASSYSQTLTGTGNQTYTMPDATTLTTGVAFVFNNNATGTLTLQDYATGAIGTITTGGAVELVLLSSGTTAGIWDVHGYLPENVTWGTNALNLGTTVITNGTWQGGTIASGYGGTGLTTFTAANNALYSTSGSALAAGTLPSAAGGTGNAFTKFSGPTTAEKTFTLPDASSTIVVQGGALGTPSSGTATNLTGTATSLNIGGNAATVTNGFYTTSSFNLGTTSVAVNRASATQSLTGINIDGSSGSCTGNAATATTATTATTANATNTSNNFQMNSLGVGTAGSGTAGEIRATNNITAYYSDIRLKTKVGDITDPLGKVRQIETMLYHANETAVALGYDASIIEVGLSAQSVQAVQPEAVAPAPIDDKYLTVRYERLVPLLLESVKALEDRIIELEAKLKG
jgi:hypothetical protein